MQNSDIRKLQVVILISASICVILFSLATILIKNNKNQAEQTAVVILTQVERLTVNHRDMAEMMRAMPTYDGIEIIAADRQTQLICGATNEEMLNQDLYSVGIDVSQTDTDRITHFIAKINGSKKFCSVHEDGDYFYIVLHSLNHINKNLPMTLLVVLIYLLLIARIVLYIVRKMTNRIIQEYNLANKDIMTGLLNRQAYENKIMAYAHKMPPSEDFVLVLADLNGLKAANDTMGHGAGDELIQGAAKCLKDHFGPYGDVFRVGGDEFVAALYIDEKTLSTVRQELNKAISQWDGFLVHKLSVSFGYAESREFPNMKISEIIKAADQRMYAAKKDYYERSGIDRRH